MEKNRIFMFFLFFVSWVFWKKKKKLVKFLPNYHFWSNFQLFFSWIMKKNFFYRIHTYRDKGKMYKFQVMCATSRVFNYRVQKIRGYAAEKMAKKGNGFLPIRAATLVTRLITLIIIIGAPVSAIKPVILASVTCAAVRLIGSQET